jgi:RNA recognition motif-containing protein
VANLPFGLDDEGLSKLFKDQKVTKAHVVKNRNGRSKGFGFVEFDNEADQKTALDASSKLSAEGRELIVKIALTAPEPSPKDAASTPAPPPPAAAKDAPASKSDEKSS